MAKRFKMNITKGAMPARPVIPYEQNGTEVPSEMTTSRPIFTTCPRVNIIQPR